MVSGQPENTLAYFSDEESFRSFLLDELSQIDMTDIERFWLANTLYTFGAKLKQKTRNPHLKGIISKDDLLVVTSSN
jgi:hypothetical protein